MLAGAMARWLWDKCPTTWFPSDLVLVRNITTKDFNQFLGIIIN